jgi:hypothetical protein
MPNAYDRGCAGNCGYDVGNYHGQANPKKTNSIDLTTQQSIAVIDPDQN